MFQGRKIAYLENLKLKEEIRWLRKASGIREEQVGRLESQYGEALSRLAEFDRTDPMVRRAMR